jgi:hypothetical protein
MIQFMLVKLDICSIKLWKTMTQRFLIHPVMMGQPKKHPSSSLCGKNRAMQNDTDKNAQKCPHTNLEDLAGLCYTIILKK